MGLDIYHKEQKYIAYEINGKEQAMIFGREIAHRMAGAPMSKAFAEFLGAGFCYFSDGRFYCKGRSETLDMDSRGKEDAKILNEMFGLDKDEG